MASRLPIETRDASRTDICFVVPPFDAIKFPPLGSAVLAAACKARGFKVRIVYGSILLAARLGYGTYRSVCTFSQRDMLGERLFVPHAYPAETLLRLGKGRRLPDKLAPFYDKVAPQIGPFLQLIVRQILATRPRIVGISTMFQQNLAAGAIARLVKERSPETCVVLGGANVALPMGEGLTEVFPWIDHFFSGEADTEFPAFCERLLQGETPAGKVVACAPVKDMDVVSAPDFSDYFASLRHYQRRGRLPAELPEFLAMETSRGCWWGEKHHCTFCGLNGEGMGFRKKSAGRVLDEIRDITETWNVDRIHAADNIMPLSFFEQVLPQLAQWPRRPGLFYEVKSNLRDEQLDLMARAGIDAIQPGIESLSSNVLRIMRKGVSAVQNISLLRACQARNIRVLWNLLYGFPGEQVEDYEATLALLPKLEHLWPPAGFSPIVIDRYSPYHDKPHELGIGPIRPMSGYANLYPADARVADIAYHFTASYSTPLLANERLLEELTQAVKAWKRQWEGGQPVLRTVSTAPGKWMITDTRRAAVQPLAPISREALAALAYFERPRPLAGQHDGHDGQIDELLERNYLVQHENALLSVVARPGAHAPEQRPAPAAPLKIARSASVPAPELL